MLYVSKNVMDAASAGNIEGAGIRAVFSAIIRLIIIIVVAIQVRRTPVFQIVFHLRKNFSEKPRKESNRLG